MKATPKPDAMQRYGADLSACAYSQATVRRMLDDAHAHYEAQVRPLAGLAAQDAGSQALGDARIDAMASAGKVALLCTELAKAHTRIDALVAAMKDAARTLEGAPHFAYTVAKGLRRDAE
jgi:hypothetical protein